MMIVKKNKKTILTQSKSRGRFKLDSSQDWKYISGNKVYGMKVEVHNTHVTKEYFFTNKGGLAGADLPDV